MALTECKTPSYLLTFGPEEHKHKTDVYVNASSKLCFTYFCTKTTVSSKMCCQLLQNCVSTEREYTCELITDLSYQWKIIQLAKRKIGTEIVVSKEEDETGLYSYVCDSV